MLMPPSLHRCWTQAGLNVGTPAVLLPSSSTARPLEGSSLMQLFITGPVCQTFQPPIWEQASRLAALVIHSPACGPSSELGERLATKTQPSLLSGGLQRKLGGTCRCPYDIFQFGHGRIRAEQEKLDLMRTHSCCPSLSLYNALLGLPALCFKAITLLTAMTEAAYLVSKSPSDSYEWPNPTTSSGDLAWGNHSGKSSREREEKLLSFFNAKKKKDHFSRQF